MASDKPDDLELLHAISTELVIERDVAALYTKILDAAVSISGSQFASMQVLRNERTGIGGAGELRLLAARGYSREALEYFGWVGTDSTSSCGLSLSSGERTIIADVQQFASLDGKTLAAFLQAGIRSMQSTPLKSRTGKLLGMITTHWSAPHTPTARDLRLMDILARQAADILERTEAEDALRESESQLRLALDGADLAAWNLDLKTGQSSWNQRHFEMQGYDADADGGSLDRWRERVHPDDLSRVIATIERARDTKSPYEDVYRIRRHDSGVERWIGSYGRFQFDAAGDAIRFSGVSQDITQRKTAELAARSNESFLQSIFAASGDCIKVCELDGRLVYMSDQGLGLVEADSFDELRDKRWSDLWPAESLDDIERAIANATSGGTGRFTGFCPTAKGTPKWWDVVVNSAVGPEGHGDRLVVVSRDVTERINAEFAVAESSTRSKQALRELELTYAQSPVGMVQLDTELRYVRINDQLAAMNGIPAADHIGRTIFEVIPDLAPKIAADFRRVIETGEPVIDVEIEGETSADPGKTHVWLESWFPLKDASGAVVGLNIVARDITEQKRHEDLQRMLIGELNHRVKNMLATVQAVASRTLRHNPNPAHFVKSFGGRIQSMSRVHSLLSEANWQPADLREVIRDQIISGPIDETRVTVWGPSVALQPQMTTHVAMMLHELGTNSIKYGALARPEGVVTISWTVSKDMLTMQWTERGGPPVKAPISRGFGSSLIEQSAKSVSGSAEMLIEAEGIAWRIELPLPPTQTRGSPFAAPNAGATASTAQPGKWTDLQGTTAIAGKRFLVVEDEPLVALDVVSFLEEAGAEFVASAGNQAEALALIKRERFDAALLDGNLAGQRVDGIAAALATSNVRFAFVTGYGGADLPEGHKDATVLSKPFSHQQLIDVAAGLVDRPNNVLQLRSP